jgi:hypothetical protein
MATAHINCPLDYNRHMILSNDKLSSKNATLILINYQMIGASGEQVKAHKVEISHLFFTPLSKASWRIEVKFIDP